MMEVIDYKQMTGIRRIPLHLFDITGFKRVDGHKPYLSKQMAEELLTGDEILVQEKLDGKSMWQKFRLGADWYYLFYEDLREVHSINYNRATKKRIIFDVWDIKNQNWVTDLKPFHGNVDNNMDFNNSNMWIGCQRKDQIRTNITASILSFLEEESEYSPDTDRIEGVVIKNYKKKLFGKIINPEFEYAIGENYIRRNRRHP